MKTAVLASILASSATAVTVDFTPADVLKQHREIHQKRFFSNLKSNFLAAREAGTLQLRKDRKLYSNPAYLNLQYYSDDTCEAKPWASGGWGSGTCVPLGTNGGASSFKILDCGGAGAGITVDFEYYGSTEDCSGNPTDEGTMTPANGVCSSVLNDGPDDDNFNIDDRFQMWDDIDDPSYGFAYGQSYQILTCDTEINKPSGMWASTYEDSTCDALQGYFGLNEGGCVPFNNYPDTYYIVMGCDFNFNKITETDDCSGPSLVSVDNDVDDDGMAGKCLEFGTPVDEDDEYAYPGDYFIIQGGQCAEEDDDLCFAGSETVLLESGETRALSEVSVGDRVQVVGADGALKFSEVVFLPHSANTDRATFTELQMASGNTLRATPAHFVLAGACGADAFELTAMKYVSEGSCVQTASGEDEVTGSSLVVDHGVYTLVTKEATGLVVVNGVRASSFALNHWLTNQYYNIHRTVYEWAPSLMKNRDVIAANLIVGDVASTLVY